MLLKALVTLDWLNAERPAKAGVSDKCWLHQYAALKVQLIKLVHRLLAGHLQDHTVNLLDVVLYGLPALLQDWLLLEDACPELHEICVALLQALPPVMGRLVAWVCKDESNEKALNAEQLKRCLSSLWWIFCESLLLACAQKLMLRFLCIVGA